jgi:AraC-like DNA-binding protein
MVDLIEIHMHNNEYTNEKLASDLGMSVAVLYRKTNALLNCTPADFFRDLRIKRAIQLLGTGKLPVSEVASRVGFDDPHYFGKWFKKNYGKTPSEVIPA